MEERSIEQRKLKEAWYFIVIPLIISAVCAWLDIQASFVTGEYDKGSLSFDNAKNVGSFITDESETTREIFIVKSLTYDNENIFNKVIRCALGYFVPSLISIVIVMIWQQTTMEEQPYGLNRNKVFNAVVVTVLYSVLFISCLFMFNNITAAAMCLFSLAYAFYIGRFCLDKRILFQDKNKMSEEDFYKNFVNKNSGSE